MRKLEGLLAKEIADNFFLSIHTVKKHTWNIYEKCNVQNLIELVNVFKALK